MKFYKINELISKGWDTALIKRYLKDFENVLKEKENFEVVYFQQDVHHAEKNPAIAQLISANLDKYKILQIKKIISTDCSKITHSLYTDGSYYPPLNLSKCAGVIYDGKKEIIKDFHQEINDEKNKQYFELIGIISGLKQCENLGIRNIRVHSDSLGTINVVKNTANTKRIVENPSPRQINILYKELVLLTLKFDSVKFMYIPRKQNKKADALSKIPFKKLIKKHKKENRIAMKSTKLKETSSTNEEIKKVKFISLVDKIIHKMINRIVFKIRKI